MSSMPPAGADSRLPRSYLLVLNRSFRRALEAENKSPRTMQAYTDAVRLFAAYCESHGQPLLAGELQREHIRAFIADQLARWKPATAHNRYRACTPSSPSSTSPAVVARNVLVSVRRPPCSPGTRTVAVTDALCTSSPAQRSISRSTAPSSRSTPTAPPGGA
jgi:hypothetical protein